MLPWTLLMLIVVTQGTQFPVVNDISKIIEESTSAPSAYDSETLESLHTTLKSFYTNLDPCPAQSPDFNVTVPSVSEFFEDMKKIYATEGKADWVTNLLAPLPGPYYSFYLEIVCLQKPPQVFDILKAMYKKGVCTSSFKLPTTIDQETTSDNLGGLIVNSLIGELCDFPNNGFIGVSSAFLFDESTKLLTRDEAANQMQFISAALFESPLKAFTFQVIMEYFSLLLKNFPLAVRKRFGQCVPRVHPACPQYQCQSTSRAAGYERQKKKEEYESVKMTSVITTICSQLAQSNNFGNKDMFVSLGSIKDPFSSSYKVDGLCKIFEPQLMTGAPQLSSLATVCSTAPHKPLYVSSFGTPSKLCSSLLQPQSSTSLFVGTYAALASVCLGR